MNVRGRLYQEGPRSPFKVRETLSTVEDPTGHNRSFSSGRITLDHYQQLGQALVMAFDKSVGRLASHFGWSPTKWDIAVELASKDLSYLILRV